MKDPCQRLERLAIECNSYALNITDGDSQNVANLHVFSRKEDTTDWVMWLTQKSCDLSDYCRNTEIKSESLCINIWEFQTRDQYHFVIYHA